MRVAAIFLLTLVMASPARAQTAPPAKELFGTVEAVDGVGRSEAIGSYAKGCMIGGREMPLDGPGWQAVRLSRQRYFGHQAMLDFLADLAARGRAIGWNGLLIGDVTQPRGGPMLTGHNSHQIGLDADIWLTPMPEGGLSDAERESFSPPLMLVEDGLEADPEMFSGQQVALIREAAISPEVARIFVHPGLKRAICEQAGDDREWLRKVRPWWGHDRHFHVRLACPSSDGRCIDQAPPPAGDGCGDDLAWWFTDEPWRPSDKPPPPDLTLADLPAACAGLVAE